VIRNSETGHRILTRPVVAKTSTLKLSVILVDLQLIRPPLLPVPSLLKIMQPLVKVQAPKSNFDPKVLVCRVESLEV